MDTRNSDQLLVQGARQHNLKDVSLSLPKGRLIAFVGVSGSGKTSMAVHVIGAEGQRRYVEALSPRLRQLVGGFRLRSADRLEGLTPTVIVPSGGGGGGAGARSSVATASEMGDLLRTLFSRNGIPHCPQCDRVVSSTNPGEIVRRLSKLNRGIRFSILAPVTDQVVDQDHWEGLRADCLARGFTRARLAGRWVDMHGEAELPLGVHLSTNPSGKGAGPLELVVDRLVVREGLQERLHDSVEMAMKVGRGRVVVNFPQGSPGEDGSEDWQFAETPLCPDCQVLLPPPSPAIFSPNTEAGRCHSCEGTGCAPSPGDHSRRTSCPDCAGTGLNGVARSTKVLGEGMVHWLSTPVAQLLQWLVAQLPMTERGDDGQGARVRADDTCSSKGPPGVHRWSAAVPLLEELQARLQVLVRAGLPYVQLGQRLDRLSAGEGQRLRLASHLWSSLSGVTYIVDEPSSGLHRQDLRLLIPLLRELRDGGNTVIVVEHDPFVIEQADWVVEFGPAGGADGGRVVFEGGAGDYLARLAAASATDPAGAGLDAHRGRLPGHRGWLHLNGIHCRNVSGQRLSLPLGCMVGVCGVSGAGKTAIGVGALLPALEAWRDASRNGEEGRQPLLESGSARVDSVELVPGSGADPQGQVPGRFVHVSSRPVRRSARSTPATYTGAFDVIRNLFSQLPESRAFGFGPERFSFNRSEGRCPSCKGEGVHHLDYTGYSPEMSFPCESCGGTRFNEATLRVRYRGLNIAQVMELTVAESAALFSGHPRLSGLLGSLSSVGLGYVSLGQPLDTMSSGEVQRLKLAAELTGAQGRTGARNVVYVLDEPTSGLHPRDVECLLDVLERLVDSGNTVVILEHDLQTLSRVDYLVEMGPGAAHEGGEVVTAGRLSDLLQSAHTASPTLAHLSRASER